MKRIEIESLNNLLINEVKSYASTQLKDVLTRICAYMNVYQALGIEEEYHKTINSNYIPYLDIDFYKMEKLFSIIEVLESYKVKIYGNVLIDGLNTFTVYLSELIWDLKFDIADKRKIEKSLNEI